MDLFYRSSFEVALYAMAVLCDDYYHVFLVHVLR